MFENLSLSERTIAIQRLTALWALNECGLGGILHALQSPFTGLLVGSIAMICIAFICIFAENKWKAVMTSLAIVLIIKALVSPHSTPTAYIAVTFQAISGAIIYRYIPNLLLASMLFVTIGLIESGIQRLLTLTILYGNTIWEAIDIWGEWITKQWHVVILVSSSRLIIYIYLLIHFISGLFIGWLIYRMIKAIHRLWGDSQYELRLGRDDKKEFFMPGSGPRRKWKKFFLFIILMVGIVFAYTLGDNHTGIQKGLISVIRAVVLLAIWFIFLAPLVIKVLKKFLRKKHQQLSEQVAHTMDIIPLLAWILDKAWKETQHLSFFRRWKSFVIHALLYILQYKSIYDTYSDGTDTQS